MKVGEPKWVFSLGEGDGSIIGADPGQNLGIL